MTLLALPLQYHLGKAEEWPSSCLDYPLGRGVVGDIQLTPSHMGA